MDKQFSHLKQRQRETISQWLYTEYRPRWLGAGHEPHPRNNWKIVDAAMGKINAAGIWIPEREIRQYFSRRKSHFKNRIQKELENLPLSSPTERTESQ